MKCGALGDLISGLRLVKPFEREVGRGRREEGKSAAPSPLLPPPASLLPLP
jgi:hypothetical protein